MQYPLPLVNAGLDYYGGDESAEEIAECFGLLQEAGANQDHLGLLMRNLREEIDRETKTDPDDPRVSPWLTERGRRLTERFNNLRKNFWMLPLPSGGDPVIKYSQICETEAGPVSMGRLRALARECAEQNARRK